MSWLKWNIIVFSIIVEIVLIRRYDLFGDIIIENQEKYFLFKACQQQIDVKKAPESSKIYNNDKLTSIKINAVIEDSPIKYYCEYTPEGELSQLSYENSKTINTYTPDQKRIKRTPKPPWWKTKPKN